MNEIGVGLWPREVTACNHSCAPTVWPRFFRRTGAPPKLEYVALRNLPCGAELAHEYVDLLAKDRRRTLRTNYGFSCACLECQTLQTDAARERRFEAARTSRDAMDDAVDAQDWPAAAAHADALAHVDDLYVTGHPTPAVHRLRCAKLRLALGDAANARVHLVLAKIRLETSHGPDSKLAAEAKNLLADNAKTLADDDDDGDSDGDFDWRAQVPRRP